MNTDIQIVILAAGKGTRMGGEIPKALTMLGDKPMVKYVLEMSQEFSKNKPITVIGYKGEMVQKSLGESSFYAIQTKQNGTGHAVLAAEDLIRGSYANTIIVLYADQPFLSKNTLEKLSKTIKAKLAKIVIATAVIEDKNLFENQFYNFGRIVRDDNGVIIKIVEKKDANKKELSIREVNPAYFCLDKKWMLEKLHLLKNNNAQEEYYLTDLVKIAFNEGLTIESVQINEKEALGANTVDQLKVLESFLDK